MFVSLSSCVFGCVCIKIHGREVEDTVSWLTQWVPIVCVTNHTTQTHTHTQRCTLTTTAGPNSATDTAAQKKICMDKNVQLTHFISNTVSPFRHVTEVDFTTGLQSSMQKRKAVGSGSSAVKLVNYR